MVLHFAFTLFGLVMCLATLLSLFKNKDYISIDAILQVSAYIGIASLGVLICFTDVVFRKTHEFLRIGFYSCFIYSVSLIYFKTTAFNPFSNPIYFVVYTTHFLIVTTLVILLWMLYKALASKQYDKLLKNYQSQR